MVGDSHTDARLRGRRACRWCWSTTATTATPTWRRPGARSPRPAQPLGGASRGRASALSASPPPADNTCAATGARLQAQAWKLEGNTMGDIRQGAAAALWQDLVREAQAASGDALDESRESYLVFVLLRHQRDERLLARIQALEWLHAQQQVGRVRTDALRDVAPPPAGALVPDLAQRRRVSVDTLSTWAARLPGGRRRARCKCRAVRAPGFELPRAGLGAAPDPRPGGRLPVVTGAGSGTDPPPRRRSACAAPRTRPPAPAQVSALAPAQRQVELAPGLVVPGHGLVLAVNTLLARASNPVRAARTPAAGRRRRPPRRTMLPDRRSARRHP